MVLKRASIKATISYGLIVFCSIGLTLITRSASLIWLHNVRGMGLDPWRPLRGGANLALLAASIQTPIVLLCSGLLVSKSQPNRILRLALSLVVLCILDLLIRPITIWSDFSTTLTFGAIIAAPPIATLISRLATSRRKPTIPYTQRSSSPNPATDHDQPPANPAPQ